MKLLGPDPPTEIFSDTSASVLPMRGNAGVGVVDR